MHFKRTLIASAVIGTLAISANANAADITVYGKLHASVGSISQDDGVTDTSAMAVDSHASRVGVKAKHELPNGMTISAKAEFEYNTDEGEKSPASPFSSRNTYVGLAGDFGEVRVGRHDTPHKMATSRLDPFGDTYADYNNIVQNDVRADNVVAYINEFGPVGFALAYAGGDDSVTGENAGSATSVMINYSAGDLYLAAAHEAYDDAIGADDETATKFGVGYTFGPAKLGLVYATMTTADGSEDATETYASLQYKLDDANTLKAAWGMRDADHLADDAVMSAIGINHAFDKSASVYALYANGTDGGLAHKAKLAGDGTAFVVGAVYKF